MMIIGYFSLAISFAYHLFCLATESHDAFSPTLSLLLSACVCLAGTLRGGLKRDLLSPPRVLSGLYFVFYPLFAICYLQYPDLGKWYDKHFWAYGFHDRVAWTVFYVTASLPLFHLGYYVGERSKWGRRSPHLRDRGPGTRINLTMFALTVVGVVGMILYARSLGGIGYMTQAMGDIAERKTWRGQGSLAYYPGLFLITAPAVCLLAATYDRVRWKSVGVGIGLLVVGLPILIVTQAAREKAMVSIVLILMCLYFFRKRTGKRIRLTKATLAGGVLAVILATAFFVQSAYRHKSVTSRSYYALLLSDFNRIDVSVVMYFDFINDKQDFLYGKPFLSYVVQPFVRFLGVEPIHNTSAVLGEAIFPNQRNGDPGAPFPGEVYVNFGFAGYILFLVVGYLFGIWHKRLVARRYEFWTTLGYSLWLYLFTFKFCIQNGFSESLLFAGVLSIQLWIIRRVTTTKRTVDFGHLQPTATSAEPA